MRTINQAGLDLIKSFEGCKLDAYLDSVGVPTIGYGSTGSDIALGLSWTQQECEDRLAHDVTKFCAKVESLVTTQVTDNEFAAMVCFAYNLGAGALAGSTLLKKVNANDKASAADEFLKWDHAGGKILLGLTRRRQAERALFLHSASTSNQPSPSRGLLPDGPSDEDIEVKLKDIEDSIVKP